MPTPLLDIQAMLPSWIRALRSECESPHTVKVYRQGIVTFLDWCESTGTAPEVTKPIVQSFVADCLEGGRAAKTVGNHLLALAPVR
jgi:site-specific recombinase XerD